MARAVVPRTAAAVDHADTELIGHDGKLGDTGFLCSGFKKMISRLCAYFPLPHEWAASAMIRKGSNYHNLLSPGTQNLGQHQNDLIINF